MSDRLLVDGRDVCALTHARTFAERSRGLLGRVGTDGTDGTGGTDVTGGTGGTDGALWLWHTTSVHTIGMRVAIDVIHLDRSGRVRAVTTMRPGRLGAPRWRGRSVVEVAAGAATRFGIVPGVVLSAGATGAPARSGPRSRRDERGVAVSEHVGVLAVVVATAGALLFSPMGHRTARPGASATRSSPVSAWSSGSAPSPSSDPADTCSVRSAPTAQRPGSPGGRGPE